MNQYLLVVPTTTNPTFTLGWRLRRARQNAGISTLDAAKRLGRSAPLVSKWEGDGCLPNAVDLKRAAVLYGVDVDWLLEDVVAVEAVDE